MNDKTFVQEYLYEHIPLSKAMGAAVETVEYNRVVLAAPLEPNINHRETVFGGSASALAILSAWTLIHFKLRRDGIESRLVIQGSSIKYDKPIVSAFTASCIMDDLEEWKRFKSVLDRWGKSRICVKSVLECENEVVARFEGEYVAVSKAAG